jgi:hypothetical protein
MRRLPRISDVIAQDDWRYKRSDGSAYRTRIIIGRPRPENRRTEPSDWLCPIYIEGVTEKVLNVMGVGPVDTLMNALSLVQRHFDTTKQQLEDLGPKTISKRTRRSTTTRRKRREGER